MEIHAMTMTMEEENLPAESTRIRIDSTEEERISISCTIGGFKCESNTLLLMHNRSQHGEGEESSIALTAVIKWEH